MHIKIKSVNKYLVILSSLSNLTDYNQIYFAYQIINKNKKKNRIFNNTKDFDKWDNSGQSVLSISF